jgi:hypothetical protein
MNEEYCSYCGACDWEGACCANCGMPNRIAELEAENKALHGLRRCPKDIKRIAELEAQLDGE